MMKEEDLQDISRALTHMLFRNVPLVEEIHAKQLIIDEEMMKNLNIEINNRIYSMLYIWFYGSEDEIQMLFKHIEFSSMYGRGTWEPARKVEI
ncbi:MAG: hypothetical protein IJE49_06865 [Agathobacter sp.]|nr:hypothetical protein [Agathobacter sp.]